MAGPGVLPASSASDFLTDETIRVDGGYAIRRRRRRRACRSGNLIDSDVPQTQPCPGM
jgi:hypothetical protein